MIVGNSVSSLSRSVDRTVWCIEERCVYFWNARNRKAVNYYSLPVSISASKSCLRLRDEVKKTPWSHAQRRGESLLGALTRLGSDWANVFGR